MSAKQTKIDRKIDLSRLSLDFGQAHVAEVELAPAPVKIGGQTYEVRGGTTAGRLDLSRTRGGYALRLRFDVELSGPCVRCLEDVGQGISVDAREVDQEGGGEGLRSPYVDGNELDIGHWADDALILATPERPLCRPDCAGLCPVCGEALNDADPAAHQHERPRDPRWAALDQLKES